MASPIAITSGASCLSTGAADAAVEHLNHLRLTVQLDQRIVNADITCNRAQHYCGIQTSGLQKFSLCALHPQ